MPGWIKRVHGPQFGLGGFYTYYVLIQQQQKKNGHWSKSMEYSKMQQMNNSQSKEWAFLELTDRR